MSTQEVIDIMRDAIFVLLVVGAPPMMAALGVGLIVSLFQALTQIQEQTLTFVPKIVAMLLTLIVTMPFIVERLTDLANRMNDRIVDVGTRTEDE